MGNNAEFFSVVTAVPGIFAVRITMRVGASRFRRLHMVV